MKSKWPEFVPVLAENDICKGMIDGPNGTHCLTGWQWAVFGTICMSHDYVIGIQVDRALDAAARQKVISLGREFTSLTYANDYQLTKAQAAKVWNETMRGFGYTEIMEDP